MTDEEVERLRVERPQDFHDDILPVRPGLHTPDDEDIVDLLNDCYVFMQAISERKLPKQLALDAKNLLAALEEIVTWHRQH